MKKCYCKTQNGKRCKRMCLTKYCWQHSGGSLPNVEIAESQIKEPFSRILNTQKARPLPYRETKGECRLSIHLGQRKLLLSEIEFLTKFGHLTNLVVYAGAAHGLHLPYLHGLFPKHFFDLYDPSKFLIKSTEHLRIVNDFFTDDDAITYKNKKILFICDIRTDEHASKGGENFETEIAQNMALQEHWIKLMKPQMSMLKFRLPYALIGTTEYLDGEIYLQVWPPQTSTETRLYTDGTKNKVYDNDKYNNQMFRFNRITRTQWYPHNIKLTDVPGLDHCYDCKSEIEILKAYLVKFHKIDSPNAIAKMMNQITKELGKPSRLDQGPHGKYPNETDLNTKCELLKQESINYNKSHTQKKLQYMKHGSRFANIRNKKKSNRRNKKI